MEIKEITGDNFQTEVTKAAQPVLLEFYADGCSFCKAQLSVLEEAAEEACDVKFVRVNGEQGAHTGWSVRSGLYCRPC